MTRMRGGFDGDEQLHEFGDSVHVGTKADEQVLQEELDQGKRCVQIRRLDFE